MWNFFKRKKELSKIEEPQAKPRAIMSTSIDHHEDLQMAIDSKMQEFYSTGFSPYEACKKLSGVAMDSQVNFKLQSQGGTSIPQQQVFWYASQGFIGFPLCAMISQHWLVKKCCLMPAKDAIRNGYEITVNDGSKVGEDVIDAIRRLDVDYRLNHNLIEFVDQGRTFGIRIAMFMVDSSDPKYYEKPFNPDGITPGSYRGISQIDPYWVTFDMNALAAGAPGSIHFYEPTWWIIEGKRIHRTHLIIFRTEQLPDILKPAYLYAGVSIPQKIYERVYAAERTANEAPLLALTKRTDVIKMDTSEGTADEPSLVARLKNWIANRDNYGIKTLGLEEEMQQFDTSLTDLDAVIMTQYQIVAAAAEIPAVKLLGTAPKGFNATGEYEEANYHEMLESIQAHDLTPLIERHWLLLIRSEICPRFEIAPFSPTVMWRPLDAMTGKELAELNRLKAETGNILTQSGAIDGLDERTRIIADPESGYTGLVAEEVPDLDNDTDNDWKVDEDVEKVKV